MITFITYSHPSLFYYHRKGYIHKALLPSLNQQALAGQFLQSAEKKRVEIVFVIMLWNYVLQAKADANF